MEIKVKAPAKINLTLEVLGKRPDGYHNISTVMQAVDLYDVITITDNDSGKVTVSCNYEGVPCDDSNICAKAAYRFFDPEYSVIGCERICCVGCPLTSW